jgi:hypothetical protein
MRTLTATAVASGLLVMTTVAAPAIADTPSPEVTRTPSVSPASQPCPFDAKAVAATKFMIAEAVVRRAANANPSTVDGYNLDLPIRIDDVLTGKVGKGPATLHVGTTSRCLADAVADARPKDQILIVGTLTGTRFEARAVTSIDHACEVKEALGQVCPATFEALNPPKTQPWLKVAAPGLAAIIASVLGLLLLRLRRH